MFNASNGHNPEDFQQHRHTTEYGAVIIRDCIQERRQSNRALVPLLVTANLLFSFALILNTISDFKVGTVMHRYNTSGLNLTQALNQIRDMGLPGYGLINIIIFLALIPSFVILLTNNPCSRALNDGTGTRTAGSNRRSILGIFFRQRQQDEANPLLLESGGNRPPAPQT